MLLRAGDRWQVLAGPVDDARIEHERTWRADRRSALATEGAWESDAIAVAGHLCLPLTAGGHPVGVLGIPDAAGPFSEGRQRMLRWPRALLAISHAATRSCFTRFVRTAFATA